ncbi:MAG: OadG family protein [Pseudomonadota bacterium]
MPHIVGQGLELAIFGMGTVFMFLTLLVLATMAMSYLVGRFSSVTVSSPAPGAPGEPGEKVPPATLAAIAAAVRRYRSEHPPA